MLSLLDSVIAQKGRNGLHDSARVGAVVAKSQDYTCSTSSFMVMSFMELEGISLRVDYIGSHYFHVIHSFLLDEVTDPTNFLKCLGYLRGLET